MNFKANLFKIISSMVLGIVGGFFYSSSRMTFGGPDYSVINLFLGFVVIFLIVYLVWSLFEK